MAELKEEKKEEKKKEEKKEFKSVKDYKLVLQAYNQSVEEVYFWFIGWFKDDLRGQCTIEKLTDVFSAAESSSYFGATQMRLGAQQEKAAGYIRGINEMSKQLFQIVREIRILNERLSLYETSVSDDPDAQSAEITLKGVFIDLVEGGGKNPSSVYGLAQQVGFTLLPDLFFRVKVNVHKNESIRRVIYEEYKEFNEKVKEVLERKLTQYYTWKTATFKELQHTRKFRLKYLKTYYHTIMMYMQWVKPYLKHIKRLSMDEKRTDTADMIAGMEQAMIEIDLLIHFKNKDKEKFGNYHSVLHMNFLYRTAPQMLFREEESYQKGPIHVGRVEVTFKGYTLTDKELDEFRKSKQEEDLELLGSINDTVQTTLESLGDDLKEYIKAEGEEFGKKKKEEEEPKLTIFQSAVTSMFGKPKTKSQSSVKNTAEIFILPFKGLLDLFDSLTGVSALGAPKEKRKDEWKEKKDRADAKESLLKIMWNTYNVFKKAHAMITW